MITVASRVKRTLHRMSRFHLVGSEDLPLLPNFTLLEDERAIGAYLNNPKSLRSAIVVTDLSLIYESKNSWIAIPYASIAKVMTPDRKLEVRELQLLLRDGSAFTIPICGGTSRTSDAFEFLRFLNRVLADRQTVEMTQL